MDWKDSPVSGIICHCKKVKKLEIILAIRNGARTLDDLRNTTGAGTGDQCRFLNPAGRSCNPDLQEMLDYYAPFAEAIRRN